MKRCAFLKRYANNSDDSFHCCGRTEDLARDAYTIPNQAGSVDTLKPMGESTLYSLMEASSAPESSMRGGSTPIPTPPCAYYLPPPPARPLNNSKSLSNVDPTNLQRQKIPQRKLSFPDRTLAEQQFDNLPEVVKQKDHQIDSTLESPASSKKGTGLSMQGISNFFRRSPRQTATPMKGSSSTSTISPDSSNSINSTSSSSHFMTPTNARSKKTIESNLDVCFTESSKAMRLLGICNGTPRSKFMDPTDGN
ncbi:hypothetical protein PTTG_25755 [Puccinia triticina 1-1 BBBD Race 1]|uniref:Uncharacterized protein n=2 Tax=Puccinia triticina TaxID=208348 RepID=A0A180H1A8_PUCT1|nr:uncharacterized protein PtA15_8A503 [Puccinia triticina]OAV98358.1 hypothetical protein PTTG_25755 [Puccinia triticina 1-1 BBBD Race 1]WAQ87599.1 hypothetical protein PtA15_8A503 [Puccinia triticina]WAR57448.1 hypothetical protein PtB15_8B495 [Puccinia triticina]